jgi:hypothetical protein
LNIIASFGARGITLQMKAETTTTQRIKEQINVEPAEVDGKNYACLRVSASFCQLFFIATRTGVSRTG